MNILYKIGFTLFLTIIYVTGFSQNWTTLTSSSGARQFNTTTVLNDGRLIIIGGNKDGVITPVVEIYNPVEDTWATVADFPVPVAGHATVCVSDSTVLVFGGSYVESKGAISVDNVWIYNLNSDVWIQKENMPIDIVNHTATVLPNNNVLIVGGYRQPSDTDNPWSFVYNPAIDTFSSPVDLLSTKDGHAGIVLNNGNVMFVGGYNYTTGMITDVEIYNPTEESWTIEGEISIGRSGGQKVIKNQAGDVLVIGGFNFATFETLNVIDKYDAQTETWTTLPNLPDPITGANVALLENGEIIVAGGQGDDESKNYFNKNIRTQNAGNTNTKATTYLTNVFSINSETGVQTTLNPLTTGRAHAETLSLPNNRVVIMYGREISYYDNGEIYGTATNPLTYNVKFHVYESDETTPASGSSIEFNSQIFETDALGQLIFNEVETGNGLPFIITKIGFYNYSGSVSISSNDIDIYATLQIGTGINLINSNNFKVYPNPSNGIFSIEDLTGFQNLSGLSITDITGKIIYTTRGNAPLHIDLTTRGHAPLQKGIYFVKINTETGIYTEKIIIN